MSVLTPQTVSASQAACNWLDQAARQWRTSHLVNLKENLDQMQSRLPTGETPTEILAAATRLADAMDAFRDQLGKLHRDE